MTARCRAEHCGRPLRTEESRARGYGPVCWRRAHPTAPVVHAPARIGHPDQIPLPLEKPVDAETRKAAIDTIARHALAGCIEHAGLDWGNYPELAEGTWDAVTERVRALVGSIQPTVEHFNAAYQHLTGQEGHAA